MTNWSTASRKWEDIYTPFETGQASNPQLGSYNDQFHMDYYSPSYDDMTFIEEWLLPERKEAAAFEREMFAVDQANKFNEYMFNKANEWNSANAQMERAKAAGINPMLAAGQILGGGAAATPMQSAQGHSGSGSIGTPGSAIANLANAFLSGTSGLNNLGQLFGFGKMNNAQIKLVNAETRQFSSTADLNKAQTKQINSTFKAYVKKWNEDAKAAEQSVLNLQKLWEQYDQEINESKAREDLYIEQENTQQEITKEEKLKKWQLEFEKQFRQTFGVQLNQSDYSMLAQLILNGHGQQLIDALSNMAKTLGDGITNKVDEVFTRTKENNIFTRGKKRFKENWRKFWWNE